MHHQIAHALWSQELGLMLLRRTNKDSCKITIQNKQRWKTSQLLDWLDIYTSPPAQWQKHRGDTTWYWLYSKRRKMDSYRHVPWLAKSCKLKRWIWRKFSQTSLPRKVISWLAFGDYKSLSDEKDGFLVTEGSKNWASTTTTTRTKLEDKTMFNSQGKFQGQQDFRKETTVQREIINR